jgi:hypothetical protein
MSPSRKKLLRVLRLAAPIFLIGAACTFPDVEFLTPGSDGGTSSSSGSGGPGGEAGPDGQPPDIRFDAAGLGDVATRSDSEAPVDKGTCPTSWKCDCDKDLFLDDECVRTEIEAGRDGGFEAGSKPGDCDDLDPVRNPEAGPRSDVPRQGAPGTPGDWNCDGTVTRNPLKLKCAEPSKVGGAIVGCNGGTDGYLADTECGETNDVWTCPTTLIGGKCDPTIATTGVKATCQ